MPGPPPNDEISTQLSSAPCPELRIVKYCTFTYDASYPDVDSWSTLGEAVLSPSRTPVCPPSSGQTPVMVIGLPALPARVKAITFVCDTTPHTINVSPALIFAMVMSAQPA